MDIIYILDLANREAAFLHFPECESASKVGRLALRNEFFCNLPGEGHLSEKDYHMRRSMPICSQFIFVFDDERSTNIVSLAISYPYQGYQGGLINPMAFCIN
jgi:hypothetical protein